MGVVNYTVANGRVIAEDRGGVRRRYVSDPLGSTVALLDNTQSKTDTFEYWPYGEEKSRTGTTPTPFRYVGTQGYYRDSANKTYVRARTLDTEKGRWLTEDPMSWPEDSLNLFAYVSGNPTTWIDRTGLYKTVGCTSEQRRLIGIAMQELCARIHWLPDSHKYKKCMLSRCGLASNGHGAVIVCRKPGDKGCKDHDEPCGFVSQPYPRQTINLCPDAWRHSECGCVGSTIVHELVHSCGEVGHGGQYNPEVCELQLYNCPVHVGLQDPRFRKRVDGK